MNAWLEQRGLERLVGFGRLLRARGLPVGTGRVLAFCKAVAALQRLDRDSLYLAGRLTMVGRKEDFDAYDQAFRVWFPAAYDEILAEMAGRLPDARVEHEIEVLVGEAMGETAAGQGEDGDEETIIGLVASAAEVLRAKSFEELTEVERHEADQAIRSLAMTLPLKRARRYRAAPHGRRFDLRRTLRASLRTEGEPFRRAWRDRRSKRRPLVLLLDISGSMSSYSRALLQFGYAAVRAGQRVEVFCFGTRLTRLTRALRRAEPDEALRGAAGRVTDWEGGTRIGASIKELLDRYGQQAWMRGAVVVLCSDGLERGEPVLLSAQMARLGRLAHRLVWVNPLKGSPRYQPLARGMAAALPHVDSFLPGHNLQSLEALCEVLALA
ncbi:MAG TPA: VWA domain-containing protein [Actinomycetes bacterium]|nr:VWA domain-containing protein [Actinomycetes bacterium]